MTSVSREADRVQLKSIMEGGRLLSEVVTSIRSKLKFLSSCHIQVALPFQNKNKALKRPGPESKVTMTSTVSKQAGRNMKTANVATDHSPQ